MTDWIVRRWTRYGHRRLYAETPGGTALGYLDLATGRYHSDDLANLPLLRHAIEQYQAGTAAPPAAAPPAAAPPAATPAPTAPPWHDLAATRAGAAARERATAEKQAQGRFNHVLARLVGARTDERAWRIGADGEEAVAARLAQLGSAWRVLHAVPVGERGADIDHVVVGPGGVFTVNAKHHPTARIWVGGNTFIVNGQRVHYIRNSRHEATRAARLLTEQAGFPVAVTGLIAVMGAARGYTVKKQPDDGAVVVVRRKEIGRYLATLPPVLTSREIDTVFEVARRSTTWRR